MKKFYIIPIWVIAISMVVIAICALAGGFIGKSAYQIALDNGFKGTEAEWLESLKGEDGASVYRGYSSYELAVQNGYEGTLLEWLESLKGETGKAGDNVVSTATSKAITSVVSVQSTFELLQYNIFGQPSITTGVSSGAGVIIDLDKTNGNAYIITNYHVVYNVNSTNDTKISDDISVYLYGQEYDEYEIPVSYIGGSMKYDIAVLKITASEIVKQSGACAAEIASSIDIAPGDTAIAIGNPKASGISITSGVISVDSEMLTMTAVDEQSMVTMRLMRIDAAVNSGNSGGGLFNHEGKLIGIVNAKISAYDIENISYAIPSEIAIGVANNLIKNSSESNKKLIICELGASWSAVTSKAVYNKESGRTHIEQQIAIIDVDEGSVADGKLETDDILLEVKLNDRLLKVNRTFILEDLLIYASKGDKLELTVERAGEVVKVEIILSITKTAN